MHCCLIGYTGSGKTTHAKFLINKYVEMGVNVVIFNPKKEVIYSSEMVKNFATKDGFFNHFKTTKYSRKIYIYIDEAPSLMSTQKYQTQFEIFMSNIRSVGWVCLSSQRPKKLISPTILSQVGHFKIFNQFYEVDIEYISKMLRIDIDKIKNIPEYSYIDRKLRVKIQK